jgi:hypothetical protein
MEVGMFEVNVLAMSYIVVSGRTSSSILYAY